MRAGARATIRFADFQLDARRLELRRNDVRVVIQPKAVELLLLLVKHRARAVSPEEILHAILTDEEAGEEADEAAVKRAVRALRQALGDSGDSEAVIRTVTGAGYQFVLPIRVGKESRPAEPAASAKDPFVGRAAATDAFSSILDDFAARRGRVVVLYGAAGVGKTRTAQEFAALARRRKALVLAADCREVTGATSLAPLVSLVMSAVAQRGEDRVRDLMDEAAAEVVEALPELAKVFKKPGAPPPIDPAQARVRLFDGFAGFFRRLADDAALVLVLDDAHEADPLTLQCLAHLASHVQDVPVAVVLCAAPERAGKEPLLPASLSRAAAATQIHLAPLDRDAVTALFQHAFDRPVPPAVVDRLNQLTRGNALHCRLVALAHARAGHPKDFAWLNAAARARSLEGAIEQSLSRVSSACRSLLTFASVIGWTFPVALLVRVANARWGSVIECLSEAVAEGLLAPEKTLASRYRFAHGLVRDAVYSGLSSDARMDAHARVALGAAALAEDPDAIAAELAHHSAEAAPLLGVERAVVRLLAAASIEARRMAYERAAAFVELALELRGGEPGATEWRLARLLERGEMLCYTADAERAGAAVADAADLARTLGDHAASIRMALALCRLEDEPPVAEQRVHLLAELRGALPEADHRRPLIVALLASSSRFEGGGEERAALAREACALAERGEPRFFGQVLRCAHAAMAGASYREERREISETLLRVARRLEDPELLLHAYRGRLEDASEASDHPSVERDLAIIDAISAQTRHPAFMRWHAAFRSSRGASAGSG